MSLPSPLSPRESDASNSPLPVSTIPAEQLFGGAKELVIIHLGEHYRLRITKNNKLILTK